MSISVRRVTKRFDDFLALDDVSVEVDNGVSDGAARAQRQRQVHAAADRRGVGDRGPGQRLHRRQGRHRTAAAGTRGRLRLPALRRVQAHDGVRQRRLRSQDPQAAEGGDRGAREPAPQARAARGAHQALPGAALGGQRQRMGLARALAIDPAVLLLDEPFGALDARVRAELREWLRRLHDETHTTTVIVTHDQEEAMEVADEVAVMSNGRIEQVGSPRDVYENPANEFVMSFVGEAHRVDGTLGAAARPRADAAAERHHAQRDDRAHRPLRLRCPRRSRPRRRRDASPFRSRATAAEELGLRAARSSTSGRRARRPSRSSSAV